MAREEHETSEREQKYDGFKFPKMNLLSFPLYEQSQSISSFKKLFIFKKKKEKALLDSKKKEKETTADNEQKKYTYR